MKQYYSIVAILLIMPLISYTITEQEVVGKIQKTSVEMRKMISIQEIIQDSIINQWNSVFDLVKAFVFENGKGSDGKKDVDIMNAFEVIEKSHNDIINVIKITSGISLSLNNLHNQKNILAGIEKSLNSITSQFSRIKFSSYNKIQAQNILLFMGKTLKDIIQEAYKNIDKKIHLINNPTKQSKQLPTPSGHIAIPQTKPLPERPGLVIQEEPAFVEREGFNF